MKYKNFKSERNLTMLADFYEFTMANGYLNAGLDKQIGYFDMYFRQIPDDGGYAIMAGLEQLIDYLENLSFSQEDIDYFKSREIFSQEFLDYLRDFKFECDVWAIPEGTPIFPGQPLVIVRGPIIQAQLIETMTLLTINHQSLIASKASRVVKAADGRAVIEFGSRRAQGYDGANYGARAAYIGGCLGTANVMVDRETGIPALGTMAHSWVQMFPTEYQAFEAYAKTYPDSCTLLIDTYDTLRSGIVNAIKVFDQVLKPLGKRPVAVRLDSGDLAYLSKEVRKILDQAGYEDCQIMASSSLDEYVIKDLLFQGAKIDSFGVGERLITSKSNPVFGGVYKLTSLEIDGEIVPKIKVSENVGKITTPGFKKVYRFYSKKDDKALADLVCLHDEEIDESKPYEIFHPLYPWKRKVLEDFYVRELLVPIFKGGQLVYKSPSVHEIKEYCRQELDSLWEETKRLEKPNQYFVDLSQDLWDMKNDLLNSHKSKKKE